MQEAVIQVKIPHINCPGSNKARMLCINSQCKANGLLCLNQQCSYCEVQHKKCKTFWLDHLITKIKQKRQPIPQYIEASVATMEQIYTDMLAKIEQDRKQLLNLAEFYGLSKDEANLMKKLTQNKVSEIHGIDGHQVVTNLNNHIKFQVQQQSLRRLWESKKLAFETIFDNFKLLFKKKSTSVKSKIVEEKDIKLIQSFFSGPIISMKLLFRASDYNFSAFDFHKFCDNKDNILVITKTQFGKIIGGYTPLKWTTNNSYIYDQSLASFLFSITEKKKFQLKNYQYAICPKANYGPTFGGGHDLYIPNDCNNSNAGYCKLGHSYECSDHPQNTQQVYEYFSGATSGFNVRYTDYEVYQLIM